MAQELSYRSKQEIMRDILGLLSVPRKPTHIMYEAKLSYPQLRLYRKDLTSRGLVVENNGLLTITNDGKKKLAVLKEACA